MGKKGKKRPAEGSAPASPRAAPASPKAGAASPKTGAASPKTGPASPKTGPASPKTGAASPKTGPAAKRPRTASDDAASEPAAKPDPYLLEEAKYIQEDQRWRNKQRTLVLCSRGVTASFRHVMEDLRKFMPHCKHEPKFEKKSSFRDLAEICELKSCNNVVYFEARKQKDLYMWLARLPTGPSIKFQVHNIHTLGEIRYSGNCLLHSRPLLNFDKAFDTVPFLKLVKQLLVQAFGTPRNHPKSKPFVDHVASFFYSDKKIYFRHYEVAPHSPDDLNDPEKQHLTEIGPRFVLDPIRILSGAFQGECIYENAGYMSPTALRIQAKAVLGSKYIQRQAVKTGRENYKEKHQMEEDELMEVFE